MNAQRKIKFLKYNWFLFYLSYLYFNIKIIFEIKNGKVHILFGELAWVLYVLTGIKINPSFFFKKNFFITKFGKYYTENDLENILVVSTAFERLDVCCLLKEIEKKIKNKKKVLFIDVGAHFGKYAILVGNQFKNYNLEIIAFEPNKVRFRLLNKNIKKNKIKKIRVYNLGLSNVKEKSDYISFNKLDNILPWSKSKKYDCIFIKMDIDGFEKYALLGAKNLINNNNITLLIEYFVDPTIIKTLQQNFIFLKKLTPYNSFWERK